MWMNLFMFMYEVLDEKGIVGKQARDKNKESLMWRKGDADGMKKFRGLEKDKVMRGKGLWELWDQRIGKGLDCNLRI